MTDPVDGTEPSQGWKPTEAQLVMPRGGDRGLLLGAIAVAAILALAVLKPWADPGYPSRATEADAPSAGPAGVAALPGAAATPSATLPGWNAPGGQCFVANDWRVFSIEMSTGRRLRHWLVVEPRAAGSPRDPAVPFVRIVTDNLLALGFCAAFRPTARRVASVEAWAVPAFAAPVSVDLDPLAAWTPTDPDEGRMFLPPTGFGAAAGAWTPGRYVFVVRHGPAPADAAWYGVEIVAPGRAPATPGSPAASPAASAVGPVASPGGTAL